MAHLENLAGRRSSGAILFASVLERIATMVAAARLRRNTAATHRLLQNLTPEQLDDIGYPEPFLPRIEVRPGLITNLMSMR